MVISNAKVTVLAAALAATGAVLNSTNAPAVVAILSAVACQIALVRAIRKKYLNGHQSRLTNSALGATALALLLGSMPFGYFEYAQLRSQPPQNDLSIFNGRDVIFTAAASRAEGTAAASKAAGTATVSGTDCSAAPREIVLECHHLLFPRSQKLEGKTLLVLARSPNKHSNATSISQQPGKNRATDKVTDKATDRATDGATESAIHSREMHPNEEVELLIHGRIYLPRKTVPAWDYDKSKKLAAEGIFSVCNADRKAENGGVALVRSSHIANSSIESLIGSYENAMTSARAAIVDTHRQHLPHKLADLLSSIVLGNRAVSLSAETTHQFRDIGLSHILAASGFNLTIVIVMTFAICRLLTPSVILCNSLCFLTMFGFVSLAGPSPSVVRAALMCSIMLLAKTGQRRSQVLSALALAFLITVTVDPLCTNDLGLQLSYAATVGIVLASEPLSRHFYGGSTKWKRSFADAISVVLIAQFSVMPIQLYFFWKAGTMFIPANLLVTPLVTPLTMIGFASSTLALLNPIQMDLQSEGLIKAITHTTGWQTLGLSTLGLPTLHTTIDSIIAFADAIAFIPLTSMVLLVNAFGSISGANFSIGPPCTASVILYYVTLLCLILALRLQCSIGWAQLAFAFAVFALIWRATPPMLTLADVHGHTILINAQHQAVDLDQDKKAKSPPSKILERFLTYCGAKLAPDSFEIGSLKSGWRFVHSQNWLLVMRTADHQESNRTAAMEILSTARKMQCTKIIFSVAHGALTDNLLPDCEFLPTPQISDTELRLIEWRAQKVTEFRRK